MENLQNYLTSKKRILKKKKKKNQEKNNISINMFCQKDKQAYPIYNSKQPFENNVNLSLITSKGNSYYILAKSFNRLMAKKTKHYGKNYFCGCCFSSVEISKKHKILYNHL